MRETIETARKSNKPYAVVLNAAPPKRDDKESPAVAQSRAFFADQHGIPVWSGQISQRAGYVLTLAAGASVREVIPDSVATSEMARLWSAIGRSVAAINEAQAGGRAVRDRAA